MQRRSIPMLALIAILGLTTASCGPGNPFERAGTSRQDPAPPEGETAGPARTLFVLERQRDDLADYVLSIYDGASEAQARFSDVETIASTFGASEETRQALAAFLENALQLREEALASRLTFDVTGTFATMILTRQEIVGLFGKIGEVVPDVPAGLEGIVTHVIAASDTWDPPAKALGIRTGFPPTAARKSGAEAPDWPDWARGSGDHPACPSAYWQQCCTWEPSPLSVEDMKSFFPSQLRTAYGVDPALTGKGRSAVVLELGGSVDPSVIDTYAEALGVPFRSNDRLVQVYLDDYEGTVGSGEATLDVEILIGMAPDLDRVTLINGYDTTFGQWLTYLPLLFSTALDASTTGGALTDVISVSMGLCELTYTGDTLAAQAAVLDPILQTAAAAGVTVAVGAGDQGSTACAARSPPYPDSSPLAVAYPASSPWVTAVGGTNLVLDDQNHLQSAGVWNDSVLALDQKMGEYWSEEDQESHWYCNTPPCRPQPTWAGGGGVSTLNRAQPWQEAAPIASAMRAVPDVSFLADIYPGTVLFSHDGDAGWNDTPYWSGSGNGTSQATPVFAALMLLLNESRGQRIGFAPPLLYELAGTHAAAFHDVVDGDNIVGDYKQAFNVDCCEAGPGYDMASGLGSIFLGALIEALE